MSLDIRVRLGLLVSACAAPLAAAAGDWDIVPRFTLEESYTDNVALSDVDASGDFITKAKPGLSVHGRGARITSDIDYNLEYVKYLDSSDFDGSNHQLQGATGIEVIADRVFVDTRSTMSQQAIDNRGLIARDTRSVNANRSDVTSYEVSARVSRAASIRLSIHPHGTYGVIGAAIVPLISGTQMNRIVRFGLRLSDARISAVPAAHGSGAFFACRSSAAARS